MRPPSGFWPMSPAMASPKLPRPLPLRPLPSLTPVSAAYVPCARPSARLPAFASARKARPAPKRRALGLQLDAWDANEIAGLAFGTALVMLALASPLFDDAVARDQRRDLGLCEACGGIGCDACGGTGKLKR